jgi:hypothetical protein
MDTNPLERLYGVFVKPQTYLNLLYLLLTFPLGIAYFTFLVTGFSLGIGLLILWVGFIILAGVLAFCWPLTIFERQMAIGMLGVQIPPAASPTPPGSSLFEQIKGHLTNVTTWKGIAFLFLKFPIGIASFVVTVTLLSLSFGLLAAPLAYPFVRINLGFMEVHSMAAALVALVFGLVIAPLSLHLLNILAGWQGQFARIMLGGNPAYIQPQPNPGNFQSVSTPTTQTGI